MPTLASIGRNSESTEYKEYIARLRAFGVPKKPSATSSSPTSPSFISPALRRIASAAKPKNPNFWETRNRNYYPDRDMTKEQREQTAALRKEQTELIKELGTDVYEAIAKESWLSRLDRTHVWSIAQKKPATRSARCNNASRKRNPRSRQSRRLH